MKYLVLVSHGKFAAGLKDSLEMLAGKRDDLQAFGLLDGVGADEYGLMLKEALKDVGTDDEFIVLGDLIGGSPLSTFLKVAGELDILSRCVIIGGMNLPVALTCVLMKDSMPLEMIPAAVVQEGKDALKEFQISIANEEEDI